MKGTRMIACLLCGDDVDDWGGEYDYTGACCACMDGLPDSEEYLEMVLRERREEMREYIATCPRPLAEEAAIQARDRELIAEEAASRPAIETPKAAPPVRLGEAASVVVERLKGRTAEQGLRDAFKFAEDSRRDADRD